ncbi:MAG: hypothetical protein QOI10_649 [Solirubrobacterales bacterium]|jgi:hypothetical protein|nr:hypothetical protein [Solirubrobacterales bacterium]
MQRVEVKHLIMGAVAGACVALAMAGGGFEATAFAAAGLIVWALVLLGLATGVVPRAEPPGAAVATGLALAGLAALTALSLAWATDDGHGFEDVVRTLAYLGAFVAVVISSRRGEARPWLAGLAVGLTAVAAVALLARFEPAPFGHPDADLARTLPAVLGRLTYPIGYWNGLASAMAAAIVSLAWFAASSPSRWVRSAAVAAMPAVCLALWMTDSRGGIVAAGLAIAVLVAVGPWRARLVANLALGLLAAAILIAIAETRDELLNNPVGAQAGGQGDQMLAVTVVLVGATLALRRLLDEPLQAFRISVRTGRLAAGVLGLAAVIAIVAADPVQQFDEFKAAPSNAELATGQVGLLRGGGSGRYQFWETAVDAFASAPIGGVGTSGYTPYWFEHREVPIPATRAHSVLFETLAELGIAGFALLVAFFGSVAVAAVRRLRAADAVADAGPALALLVVGFAAAAVDWTWDLPAVFGITIVAAALLTGPATVSAADGAPPPARWQARSRRRFAGGVVLLLVAWVSICASGLLLLSAHSLDSSRGAAADGRIDDAVKAANDAIDLQPWAAEPRTQLALVYEQAGDYERARAAIGEAIDRSSDEYRLRLLAARMAAEDDDPAAAHAELLAAHELNPRDPDIIQQLAAAS